jgi:hypothetical protein
MTRDWLYSRFGINFVAVGLVAALVVVAVIVIQDVSFLVTGLWPKLPWYRDVLYHLLAAVAAIFSVVSFFIFRPGMPRFVLYGDTIRHWAADLLPRPLATAVPVWRDGARGLSFRPPTAAGPSGVPKTITKDAIPIQRTFTTRNLSDSLVSRGFTAVRTP